MKRRQLIKNFRKQFSLYSFFSQFIFLFYMIKFCNLSCEPNLPFLKNGICVESCTIEEVDSDQCTLKNEIIKNQSINNINDLTPPNYIYFNVLTTKNDDLIILISTYPAANERLFYGFTKDGRGYFKENGQETNIYLMKIQSPTDIMRFESESFMVKLKSTSETKEYIMDFGKTPQLLQLYDLENRSALTQEISSVFSDLGTTLQTIGAKLKFTSSNYNYYLIGLVLIKNTFIQRYTLSLIKFNIESVNGRIIVNQNKKELQTCNSTAISCYETSAYYIACFYKNNNNEYTMAVFSSNLEFKNSTKIQNGKKNDEKFYKCTHFYDEVGAFVYYTNDNSPYANIDFKEYNHGNNKIKDYFPKMSFNGYSFYYNYILNDIIKVFDKKIYFASVSLNKKDLYIISIYNYDSDKIITRIYKTFGFNYNKFSFYKIIRLHIYVNYLVFGSNGGKLNQDSGSFLTIFSYPNSIDINNELTELLFNKNEIKIDNITLAIKDLCKMENNIFGYILTGIKKIDFNKTTNEYLSFLDGTEIIKTKTIEIDKSLKLIIQKSNNIFSTFK